MTSSREISPSDSQEQRAEAEGEKDGTGVVQDTTCSVQGPSSSDSPVSAEQRDEQRTVLWLFKRVSPKTPFTMRSQFTYIFHRNYIMTLFMFCCPVGLVLHHTSKNLRAIFAINLLSTLPANYFGNLAMTEIGLRVPRLLADFLSISTGNLIQYISCVVLLRTHEYNVLQTSITGSILANTLFFLGLSIFVGCLEHSEQNLNRSAAHIATNLLFLSSTSLLIPTASHLLNQAEGRDLLRQSRGVAIVLLVVYICFVICEYWTSWEAFCGKDEHPVAATSLRPGHLSQNRSSHTLVQGDGAEKTADDDAPAEGFLATLKNLAVVDSEPHLHFIVAVLLLVASTALLYFNIDYCVQSIDGLTKVVPLSKTFVGLVLFPLANVDYVPILLAATGELGHTVTQTVGKSIQTALLVMPAIVLLAWTWGLDEVNFIFNGFEVVSLFAAVLLVNFLMMDIKLHW
ncbi:hypothetical protein ED733_002605 [Metarhizium rileyi]|uniref:Sodium/calcium exchanger membrane region domain-containing protein n=1 Tax=Metarhizium rileyi (strain RCEF 4871) TaxID=1649241 RepID=A0A5C6G782_METRR|nr:hypothetical protein ED733_002605 [Metarhizium rileyi]